MQEESSITEETVQDHIKAAAKLVTVKLFVGLDISDEITLSGDDVFTTINDILKDNYGYSIGKFTYFFFVKKTVEHEALEHGINLKIT